MEFCFRTKVEEIWNQLRKGLLQMLSANVLNKAVMMLSNMVITRLMTKAEYGLWSYVLNIYSYLSLISGLGLLSGAFQFGTENRGEEAEYRYFKYCLKAGLVIDTFLVVVFSALTIWMDFTIDGAGNYIRLYLPVLLLEYLLNLLLSVLRCENRIQEYAKVLNINTVFTALFTCIGAAGGVGGILVGKYTAFIASVLHIVTKIKPEISRIVKAGELCKAELKPLWHYSLFTGASSAMNCLLYLLDVSMIAYLIQDPIEIATYKVATLIPTAITFIPSSVIVCILPNIIDNRNNQFNLKRIVKKTFLGLGAFNAVLVSGLIIFAPLIITILSGKQYLPAVPAFQVLTFGYFVSGTFRSLSANILAGLRKVNFNLIVSIISGISDIFLNFVLIKKFNTIGAAYATMCVEILASLLAFSFLIYCIWGKRSPYEPL